MRALLPASISASALEAGQREAPRTTLSRVLVVLIVILLGSGTALALFGLAAWALGPLAVALGVVVLSRQRPVAKVSDDQANRIQLSGRGKRKDFF